MPKTTISARVPVQFKTDFNNWCKANDTTISEHLQSVFENVDTKTYVPKADAVNVDGEMKHTLVALGGGTMIAYFVYKGIVRMLTDKYPMIEKEDIKLYALAGATTVGLLGGIGVNKLINLISE